MTCSTEGCFAHANYRARLRHEDGHHNVYLMVCISCALLAEKLGAEIRRLKKEDA